MKKIVLSLSIVLFTMINLFGMPQMSVVVELELSSNKVDFFTSLGACDSTGIVLDTAIVYNSLNGDGCFTSVNFNDYVTGLSAVFTDCNLTGIDVSDANYVDFDGFISGSKVFCCTIANTSDTCVYQFVVVVIDCLCPSVDLLTPDDLFNNIDTLFLNDEVKNTVEAGSWTVISGPQGQDLSNIMYNGSSFVTTGLIEGEYELEFLLLNPVLGCDSISTVTIGISDYTATKQAITLEKKFSVFPNPTSDIFTIELLESRSKKVEMSIYSLTGKRMVVKEELLDNGKLNVDLSSYVKGIYLIVVEFDQRTYFEKVVLWE